MLSSDKIDQLAAALAAAQAEFSPVGKSGQNAYDKYAYANLADYMAAAPPQTLAKHGLSIVESVEGWERLPDHETKSGGREYATHVTLAVRLLHTSGQWIEVSAQGEGMDRADKSTYMATTGARKYAIACLLRLVTTDDPERADAKGDAHGETRTKPAARPRPPAQAKPAASGSKPPALVLATVQGDGMLLPERPAGYCDHAWGPEKSNQYGKYRQCSKCRAFTPSEKAVKALWAVKSEMQIPDDYLRAIYAAIGIEHTADLDKSMCSALIDWLKALNAGSAIPADVQAVQDAMGPDDRMPWDEPQDEPGANG